MKDPRFRDDRMSSIASVSERIIREVMIERGVKKPEARKIVAREMSVAPGSLDNLQRGRLVHVERLVERINAYLVRRIEKKIAQLEGELATARLASRRAGEIDVLRAETALIEARKALGK